MSTLRISVVITAYNLERFIGEALSSALGQTRRPDEIIVVDDHSTDRTPEIVASFGSDVRLIRHEANIGALRNTLSGLDASTGDLVAFLDGDDTWHPTKLEKIEALFRADPRMVIASHDHRRVDAHGVDLGIVDDTNANIRRVMMLAPSLRSDALRDSILFRRGYWLGSAYVVRRATLDLPRFHRIIDGAPELTQWSYLDLVFGPYVVASNPEGTVGMVDEVLFDYRIHDAGTSGSTVNIQRTRSSLHRSQSTNKLTKLVLDCLLADPEIRTRYTRMDEIHQLARYQYDGERALAIRHFFRILRHLSADGLVLKELVRLTATTAIGIEGFLKAKNRFGSLRQSLRPSRSMESSPSL